MVDTTEGFFASRTEDVSSGSGKPATLGGTTYSVKPVSSGVIASYAHFAGATAVAAAQHPEWVAAWAQHANPHCLIAFILHDGAPAFAMPLEIVRHGPFGVARIPGGSHANGNFFAATSEFRSSPNRIDELAGLFRAVGKTRPDIDIVALERLAHSLSHLGNPLDAIPAMASPNVALAADLAGGFDALLERSSGKRKRKKNRSQLRKFEAAGGFKCFRATNPEDVSALLSAFFAMKQARFRKMGVADVFGGPEIQAFFGALFTDALKAERPPFLLSGLEVGGKLRAVAGYSCVDDRMVCDFVGFAEDDLYAASPGEFLFFTDIRQACSDGFKIFDFSVGDEPYKRTWCDIETRHFDVVVPLTAKGGVAAAIRRAKTRAKSFVKNTPLAWRLLRMARGKASSKPAAHE